MPHIPKKNPSVSSSTKTTIESAWHHRPVWQFSTLDFEHGDWGWKNFRGETLCREVLKKLSNYESMTWYEIFSDKKRNHAIPIEALTPEAQKCIRELKLDNTDDLYRLRLNGKERIWGILEGYVFKIIWWDPKHTVCLSTLKHT